ncbi:unnamed protein product [Victoria cruziana]
MNLNFKMTDPSNPVHIMSYSGARGNASQVHQLVACKGVLDTAVRTSDAGYLMHRLVEVVQHIVVHRTDCGSTRGISVSRVLENDVYLGLRCIATRNKYIGIGLVNRFMTSRAQSIYIRTPFTCRSASWIC